LRRNTNIIGIALGLTLASATFAQAEGYAGFRGGLNLASFSGPTPTGTRTGFTGGISSGRRPVRVPRSLHDERRHRG
jgi:hypothetical protein